MTENIQHIRLINGEELIGDVVDYYDNKILVSQPLLVNERMSQTGKSAIVLTKYIPFSSSSFPGASPTSIIRAGDGPSA